MTKKEIIETLAELDELENALADDLAEKKLRRGFQQPSITDQKLIKGHNKLKGLLGELELDEEPEPEQTDEDEQPESDSDE